MPVVICGECNAKMKVPDTIIGRKIRCKSCSEVFIAEDSDNSNGDDNNDDAPIQMKQDDAPKKAKPVSAKKAVPAKAINTSRNPSKNTEGMGDDADDLKSYGVNLEGENDLPRCPFCAKELESEGARICLNCGYDTVTRSRNRTKAVYEPTGGERFMHLLPGIGAALAICAIVTGCVFCFLRMDQWLVGTWMEQEGNGAAIAEGEKRKWNVNPGLITLWTCIFSAFICWKLLRMAIKRLVYEFQPPEKKIEAE
jgi:hypothetical protein